MSSVQCSTVQYSRPITPKEVDLQHQAESWQTLSDGAESVIYGEGHTSSTQMWCHHCVRNIIVFCLWASPDNYLNETIYEGKILLLSELHHYARLDEGLRESTASFKQFTSHKVWEALPYATVKLKSSCRTAALCSPDYSCDVTDSSYVFCWDGRWCRERSRCQMRGGFKTADLRVEMLESVGKRHSSLIVWSGLFCGDAEEPQRSFTAVIRDSFSP